MAANGSSLWVRASRRRLAAYGFAAATVLILLVTLGREVAYHVEAIEAWLEGLGPLAPVVYVALVIVLTTLFVPDTLVSMVAGALFGPWQGLAVIVCGGLAGAALQYVLARRLFAGLVRRLIESRPGLRKIQLAVRSDELRMQALLRLTPLNPTTVTLVLSAADVRFGTFMLACLALIPAWFTQVYFGYVGKHMATSVATKGAATTRVEDVVVLVGLAALITVIVLVSRAAQRAVAEATGS